MLVIGCVIGLGLACVGVVRFLFDVGAFNSKHHLTPGEWTSLVTGPMPADKEANSNILPASMETSETKRFVLLGDSGTLVFKSKGHNSLYPYLSYYPGWKNMQVISEMGATLTTLCKFMECTLFSNGAGPMPWRNNAMVANPGLEQCPELCGAPGTNL